MYATYKELHCLISAGGKRRERQRLHPELPQAGERRSAGSAAVGRREPGGGGRGDGRRGPGDLREEEAEADPRCRRRGGGRRGKVLQLVLLLVLRPLRKAEGCEKVFFGGARKGNCSVPRAML